MQAITESREFQRLREQVRGTSWRQWAAVCAVLAVLLLSLFFGGWFVTELLVEELESASVWMHRHAPFSIILYFLLFTLAMFLLLPANAFAVGLGYCYGVFAGLIINTCAVLFAANVIAFVTPRFLKGFFEAKMRFYPKMAGLRQFLRHKASFQVVFIACQTPIPFGLQVAFFALAGVPPLVLYPSLVLGMMPAAILSIYLGDEAAFGGMTNYYNSYNNNNNGDGDSSYENNNNSSSNSNNNNNNAYNALLHTVISMIGIFGFVILGVFMFFYGPKIAEEVEEVNAGEVHLLRNDNNNNSGDKINNNSSNFNSSESGFSTFDTPSYSGRGGGRDDDDDAAGII